LDAIDGLTARRASFICATGHGDPLRDGGVARFAFEEFCSILQGGKIFRKQGPRRRGTVPAEGQLIVLALDTALAACSVCLFDAARDKVIASESLLLGRGHAEALLPMLERVIAKLDGGWAKVERIGVVVGPGSFTGLRVGISAARAAALAIGCPAVGISTLAALAAPLVGVSEGTPIAAAIDARHGNVFFQIFSSEGQPLGAPAALSLEESVARIGERPVHLVGSASPALQEALARAGGIARSSVAEAVPDIVCVAKLAVAADPRTAPPDPLYVKRADARPLAERASA
jgi:tRNA threonylcarbamoyladenosine biosynthesis protein TsaB